ncbi:MAG: DUF2927 domain-containing protein [Leptolyngbyaceae bacterium]|nr:DUF2927 domain-containing protein [Leptolyngbyaceae bacterium]
MAPSSQSILTAQNTVQAFVGCSARLTANSPNAEINYRSAPSLAGQLLGRRRVGDRLTVLATYLAPDGYTWYGAQFDGSQDQGWVRGDLVTPQRDCINRRAPESNASRSAASTASSPQSSSSQSSSSQRTLASGDDVQTARVSSGTTSGSSESDIQTDRRNRPSQARTNDETAINWARTTTIRPFDQNEINYFLEVAIGSELGNASAMVRRWENDICINLNFPTQENISRQAERAVRSTVDEVISDINGNFDELATIVAQSGLSNRWEPIEVAIAGDGCSTPNVEFYYVQAENFSRYDPNVRRGQVGHVWTWWNQNEINRARILISSNYLNERERDHVIREELTQSLGILKDSWDYQNSIFYQGWTSVTDYDPIDEAVIQMLYHPAIRPGIGSREAQLSLGQL